LYVFVGALTFPPKTTRQPIDFPWFVP